MGEIVKKELEDGDSNKTAPDSLQTPSSDTGGDEDVPLAQLTHAPSLPKLRLPSSASVKMMASDENCSPIERRGKRVKIKRRYSESSKVKHAGMGRAGSCICCREDVGGLDELRSPGAPEVKSSAMIRAEEVQSNLEPGFPSFIKLLVRSHVASCFWMGLPGPFCRTHLPHEDDTVTLEDETGKGFQMKYLAYKTGLSAGWRQFSVAHKLLEGDVLVFQLIEPCKFKVYILRAHDLTEVDGALSLLNLDAPLKQNDTEDEGMTTLDCISTKRKRPRSLPLAVVQKKNKKSGRPKSLAPKSCQPAEQSENDSEEVGSEVLEGFKLSLPAVQFQDIKSFEDFNILVDGLVLDSELAEDIRSKYYKLCCSQNAFLHDDLFNGINFKLVAGIIAETVNIADAMQAFDLTTSRNEFGMWDKTLKGCEHFGMNVGFLRTRLSKLVNLAFDSEGAAKTRRYIEARTDHMRTEDEIRNLEAKLLELKEAHERYDSDLEGLKSKAKRYELKFQEEVLAPW